MNLKKLAQLPFRAAITGTDVVAKIGMFFLLLPLLPSETSGSKKGPVLKLYEKGFRGVERAVSTIQVGQSKWYQKLGLLTDDEFQYRNLREYMHAAHGGDLNVGKRIDALVRMSKGGYISDVNAARLLSEETHSSELQFSYNSETKSFGVFGNATDEDVKNMQAAWDKLQDWAIAKAAVIPSLKGELQASFASAITGILQGVPVSESENDEIAISPRINDRNRLMVIFKKAVDGEGQPLVATEMEAKPLPAMINSLKSNPEMAQIREMNPDHDMVSENDGFAKYLEDYKAKKAAAPKVA